MAKEEEILAIYTGAALNLPATNVIRTPSITGTITEVYLDFPSATDGAAEFELFEDGVSVTTITVADTTSNENVTGLSFSSTLGKVLSLSLLSPLPTTLPAPPWSLIVTVEVTETHVPLTGYTGTVDLGGASSLEIPNSATPTVNADGEIAVDTTVADFSHGIVKVFAGEETALVAMPVAELTTPTDGHVVAYNATNDEFELVAQAAAVSDGDKGDITVSGSGATWTIDATSVTYAKIQNISATARILGRKTAGAGDTEECTLTEILDFIGSAAQGDILYRGAAGWARLGAGTSGFFLKTQGAAADPIWDSATGSGAVATDAIWDAAGDLAVGTGADTAAKLTMGSALQVLRVNAGATTLEYADPAGGGGISWTEVTTTSQSAAVNNGYITNNAGLVTVTLPATAAVGDIVAVQGLGAGGWKVAQNASQDVKWLAGGVDGTHETTAGTGGSLASTDQYDAVELICLATDNTWGVRSAKGVITLA